MTRARTPAHTVVDRASERGRRINWKPVTEQLLAGKTLFLTNEALTRSGVKYLQLFADRLKDPQRVFHSRPTIRMGVKGRDIWIGPPTGLADVTYVEIDEPPDVTFDEAGSMPLDEFLKQFNVGVDAVSAIPAELLNVDTAPQSGAAIQRLIEKHEERMKAAEADVRISLDDLDEPPPVRRQFRDVKPEPKPEPRRATISPR